MCLCYRPFTKSSLFQGIGSLAAVTPFLNSLEGKYKKREVLVFLFDYINPLQSYSKKNFCIALGVIIKILPIAFFWVYVSWEIWFRQIFSLFLLKNWHFSYLWVWSSSPCSPENTWGSQSPTFYSSILQGVIWILKKVLRKSIKFKLNLKTNKCQSSCGLSMMNYKTQLICLKSLKSHIPTKNTFFWFN